MTRLSNPSRIRHATVAPVTDCRGAKVEKAQSVTNPSRALVTDSDGVKGLKYREKHTLSPFLYESVTYPHPRCVWARTRIREGGVTDSRDGFDSGDLPCLSGVIAAGSSIPIRLLPRPMSSSGRATVSVGAEIAAAIPRWDSSRRGRDSRSWPAATGAVSTRRGRPSRNLKTRGQPRAARVRAVGHGLAHVASLVPPWPTGPTPPRARHGANCAKVPKWQIPQGRNGSSLAVLAWRWPRERQQTVTHFPS